MRVIDYLLARAASRRRVEVADRSLQLAEILGENSEALSLRGNSVAALTKETKSGTRVRKPRSLGLTKPLV